MDDFRKSQPVDVISGAKTDVDAGLRTFMQRVFLYMGAGVGATGLLGLFVSNMITSANWGTYQIFYWIATAVFIGMGFFSQRLFFRASPVTGHVAFWAYVVAAGVITGGLFAVVNTQAAAGLLSAKIIPLAFLISASMFLSAAFVGYVTKKDLSGLGLFLSMAVVGLFVAMLVNAFIIKSAGMSLWISVAVVIVFAAMTAYEVQSVKNFYHSVSQAGDQGQISRFVVFGAFMLYGSFVIMFWHVLNILMSLSRD